MRAVSQQGAIRNGGTRPSVTLQTQERNNPGSYRTTARVIGVLYLAGMVLGIGGNVLIQSILTAPEPLRAIASSSMLLAVGAVLWLVTVVGDAAHGVLMYPVLKRHSGVSAVGYLAARIVDAMLIAVMTLLIVIQIPVGVEFLKAGASDTSYLQALSTVLTHANLYAYDFGMTALGVAGIILCNVLLRAGLLPRPLAVWGLAGYAIILAGSLVQVLGFPLYSIQAIPGGLWEIFIGVWLIVKGFSTPANSPEAPTAPSHAVTTSPLVGSEVS